MNDRLQSPVTAYIFALFAPFALVFHMLFYLSQSHTLCPVDFSARLMSFLEKRHISAKLQVQTRPIGIIMLSHVLAIIFV